MGFAFYVLGLNVGAAPRVVGALLAGTAAAVAAEAVVVYHDALVPSAPWFPDPMPGRARGTFKANGQLGAYGFCAAGLLATFGAVAEGRRRRTLFVLAALLSASFVFPASRRTGMFCVFLWAAVFLVTGVRFARRASYRLLGAGLLAAVAGIAAYRAYLEHSFLGRRVQAAVHGLRDRDNFIERQHRMSLRTVDAWFPWGFGAGRGHWIDPRDGHEVHNGLLAVFVEQGALGLVGFAGMMLYPLLRRAGGRGGEDADLFRAVRASFLLVSLVFAAHNTLYRDRTFLLYLGLATSWDPPAEGGRK
ncbi:MAG: O-antigen ligase family protein [Planctomycetota bacterium]